VISAAIRLWKQSELLVIMGIKWNKISLLGKVVYRVSCISALEKTKLPQSYPRNI